MNFLYTILINTKPSDIFQITFLTICFYILHFYYLHFTRTNPLPGPMPIPLIGTFEIFRAHIDIDAWFYKLTQKYGQNGVFELNLIGNRQIVITRAEYVNKFMTPASDQENHMKHLMRTANNGLLDLFDLDCKGVGLNHNYNFWKFNRQIFYQAIKTACYAEETCKLINNLYEEMINYWINLKKSNDDSVVVDAAAWMRRFTNDFISVVATSERTFAIKHYYQILNNEKITQEILDSEDFVECISNFFEDNQMIFIPKVLRKFPLIRGRVHKMMDTCDYLYKRLVQRIRRRRKEVEKLVNASNFDTSQLKNDLLTSMVVANTPYETTPQKNVDPSLLRPMTDDEIRGIMFDAFAAGTDTTANTFCFVLYYITHHPEVKKKLLEELRTVFKDDLTRPVTMDDLNKLRYCEAIINETSRIRPTVSMVSRYGNQADEVAGYKWPADILFIMYVRGINNNSLYWKDPEKFNPDRFYDPQEIEKQHKFGFTMFGGGLRMCLGRNLAMIEMKILLASLYRKFDVELVDMKAPLNIRTSTVTICKNLDVRIIPKAELC
ncbi:cytochrome P450 [Gigaspora margarita]|uniref:Cytochrome P450 n=1 Tax=Gigaspora margarita TaxID=4874 RepID=A0A8H4EUK3_GIGMA|nr:cytochrome P450 [Gigaspora margarita]